MDFDQPPVVRVSVRGDHGLAGDEWPMTIPAVAQVVRRGLALSRDVTFLVGDAISAVRRGGYGATAR